MFSFPSLNSFAKPGLAPTGFISTCVLLSVCVVTTLSSNNLQARDLTNTIEQKLERAKFEEIITHSTNSDYMKVTLNQITLVKLDEPITDALIGNPAIADITIQNGKTFIITGKSYGRTNIILMNKKGETIFNKSVYVDDDNQNVVRIQRGNMRLSYTCTPHCQPTPTLGDDPAHSKLLSDNLNGKLKTINDLVEGNSRSN